MTKILLPEHYVSDYYWAVTPVFLMELPSVKRAEVTLPLSSSYDIKYLNLSAKLDKLADLPKDEENSDYLINSTVGYLAKELLKEFSTLKIMERDIAVHLFSNQENGVQFELDGDGVKADIEILASGEIIFTSYMGEKNEVEELPLTIDSFYLLNDYLFMSKMQYA